MSGDIFNGWEEDGEPVSDITAQDRLTVLEVRVKELEAFLEAPTKCVECGSWGPFVREALSQPDEYGPDE